MEMLSSCKKAVPERTSVKAFCLTALLACMQLDAGDLTVEQAERFVGRSFPNAEVAAVNTTAVPGIYEVFVDSSIYYLTKDGRFLFSGTLYDLETQVDLTEKAYSSMRLKIVDRIGNEQLITFAPDKYKYTINAFTDVNCPYCRKFHTQVERLNAMGVRVNYLLVAFLGEDSAKAARNVWCSDDPRSALSRAKQGAALPDKTCSNPVDQHARLAEIVGVRGTPAFLFENGELINGYQTPEVLLQEAQTRQRQSP